MGTALLRCSAKLCHLATAAAANPARILSFPPLRLSSSSAPAPASFFSALATARTWHLMGPLKPYRAPFPQSQVTERWKSSETRVRAPATPVNSKLNKYKIKGYSSYKRRFKALNDGTIRRWKEGNAHNAHSKSKKQKRRLRKPAIVSLAYAKTMKKLNFFA